MSFLNRMRIGMDIGSTTVKVVVVSQKEDNGLLYNIRDAGMLKTLWLQVSYFLNSSHGA